MVDFKKLLKNNIKENVVDPIAIFEKLDKESGKEYLRPPQNDILSQWYEKSSNDRDVIVKLHTGEGKTLIGLLMLQSSLNDNIGPAVYICPDNYLVEQTINVANSFGIKTVKFNEQNNNFPSDFISSKAILVINCQKLFNGKSIFGVTGSPREIIELGSIVFDDAHSCIKIIKDSFSIQIKKTSENGKKIYDSLFKLFHSSLYEQRPGTVVDIETGEESIMAVPYWTWDENQEQIIGILKPHKSDELLFTWDLIKDELINSTCIFTGNELEISPRLIPIDKFQSFTKAKRRIFLSATLMEDDLLVRDLDVDVDKVKHPLTSNVKKHGERMLLIPSLVSSDLTKDHIIKWVSDLAKNRNFGVFSLVPSFNHAEIWQTHGGIKTTAQTLQGNVIDLKKNIAQNNNNNVIILVNKYDGIDLPDNLCRILCMDSMPMYDSLLNKYMKQVRQDSDITFRQQAQRIEQGIGRGIRGSNDWCVVIIIENKLTNFLAQPEKRKFFTPQTQIQIDIAERLIETLRSDSSPNSFDTIKQLVQQCIDRDSYWKTYYQEHMQKTLNGNFSQKYIELAYDEKLAEMYFKNKKYAKMEEHMQFLIDQPKTTDKGWYCQLLATYFHKIDPVKSSILQNKAHSLNAELFFPQSDIEYSRVDTSVVRNDIIFEWIKKHKNFQSLIVSNNEILNLVDFNQPYKQFEDAIMNLGLILGFGSQRPEFEFKKGSDNLWHLEKNMFFLISCKNNTKKNRQNINQKEAKQMLAHIEWFNNNYSQECVPVFFHHAKIFDDNAIINRSCYVITPQELDKLKKQIKVFYNSFRNIPFENIDTDIINDNISKHALDVLNIRKNYFNKIP